MPRDSHRGRGNYSRQKVEDVRWSERWKGTGILVYYLCKIEQIPGFQKTHIEQAQREQTAQRCLPSLKGQFPKLNANPQKRHRSLLVADSGHYCSAWVGEAQRHAQAGQGVGVRGEF